MDWGLPGIAEGRARTDGGLLDWPADEYRLGAAHK